MNEDLETVNVLVARLKTAPQEHIPKTSMVKISEWRVPTETEVRAIISAGGVSPTARRLLLTIEDSVRRIEEWKS